MKKEELPDNYEQHKEKLEDAFEQPSNREVKIFNYVYSTDCYSVDIYSDTNISARNCALARKLRFQNATKTEDGRIKTRFYIDVSQIEDEIK